MSHTTHITGKVLLLAQDGLIPIELAIEKLGELFDEVLIRDHVDDGLDPLFEGDETCKRFKLRILHACRLLKFRKGLGLAGDQLRAGPLSRKVAADGAWFEQLKAVFLLLVGDTIRTHEWLKDFGSLSGRDAHSNIWHLAERLVLNVRRLLLLASFEIDGDELVRDVTFLCYDCYAARGTR
jgi:hypothetical protein